MTDQKRDETEIPEIVGSTDLRQMFADKGEVKGSFFINNVEFHQFRANSVDSLVAQINARENEAFVTASIDDGYHLVLEAHSPAPIMLRAGAPYADTPAAGTDATASAVRAAIEATKADQKNENKNTILEDLGLEASQDPATGAVPGVMGPGMSAEDRKKARHDRAIARGAIRGVPEGQDNSSRSRAVPQVGGADENRRYNPVNPSDKVMPPGGFVPGNSGHDKNWTPGANNPTVQVAPASNSDGQPTVDDLSRV